MATAESAAVMPRVRWAWLWDQKADLTWNLIPFWLTFPIVVLLLAARDLGGANDNPLWNFTVEGREVHLMVWVMYFYGPLIDAPHLWATIARTYTDRDEWAARRRLFLGAFAWFAIGPIVILLPYALRAMFDLPAGTESFGWVAWSNFFTFYALFHINKQHWGFVMLYKRKNGDLADARENRVDSWFFYSAIWLPWVAMMTAPWYRDFDGKPFSLLQIELFGTTAGTILHDACHAAFFAICIAYVAFQIVRYREGADRNGPKLLYLATIIPLYYMCFAIHPLLAGLWVLITGLGHCAQYHRVVWAYGVTKYAGKSGEERRLPSSIFENVWLYVVLGLSFGVLTLQGPGSGMVQQAVAGVLQGNLFAPLFRYMDQSAGLALGLKVAAAFVSGVRLHHFYVDSKIWRVSKSAQLAKNLNV